jgi:uroporphyrinogen decarboxylase
MPIVGFAGAPFTVASYAIEGKSSRNFIHAKTMMYDQPAAWSALMDYLADFTADYLNAQIDAGADVVQLFDSWVGCLSPTDYCRFVQPYTRRVIAALRPGTPVIQFGTMTGELLEVMRDAGGDVIGVDWRVELNEAIKRLGPEVAVQGNLDPVALLAHRDYVQTATRDVLRRSGHGPGYVFNLGHGILPETPVDNVLASIETVHEYVRKPS